MEYADDALRLCRIQQGMENKRRHAEKWWEECSRLVLPSSNSFTDAVLHYGEGQTYLYNSVAPGALSKFSAAIEHMLTPRGQRWHGLVAPQRAGEMGESWAVEQFFEDVTDRLFEHRYSGRANFAGMQHQVYESLGAFGNGAKYIEPDLGRGGIKYAFVPTSELYVAYDMWGKLARVHRRYKLEYHAARAEFGKDALPTELNKQGAKDPFIDVDLLHAVELNEGRDSARADAKGMQWASWHVIMRSGEKKVMRRGGYRTMPYVFSRYAVGDGQTYGFAPALQALADIRMLNVMDHGMIKAGDRAARPPLLASDDDLSMPPVLKADAINYGWLDAAGNPKVRPLEYSGRYDIGLDIRQDRVQSVNDFFLVTLFQILVESPTMTATEVLERAAEKATLLAPTMGRLQSEDLAPLIEREIDCLDEIGDMPEMPMEVQQFGGVYDVEYRSPLARMQRAENGSGIMRGLEVAQALAMDGNFAALKRIKRSETLEEIWKMHGAPLDLLYSPEEYEEILKAEAEAAEAQQMMAAAPGLAKAARDGVEAENAAEMGGADV